MTLDGQLKLQSLLDEELEPLARQEITDLLARDAEARALFQELQTTKQVVRANEPEPRIAESREFYWSKIARQIEAENARRERESRRRPFAWLGWLIPAGAAGLLAFLLITSGQFQPFLEPSESEEIEAPVESATVISFHSDTEGVSVVWIASN